ncbi:ThiF family adenylyltransferase, partial [bacterium]|nr:ThiF family adenylyltransferase [bacterium]
MYIEISSFEFGKGGSKIPFALLPINSNPSSDQCISFLPVNYLELAELLENKLYTNLDEEILNFISITYKRGVFKKYRNTHLLDDHFLIAICIPRLNSVGQEVGNEIVAFDLFESVKNIGKALGCIREQPGIKTKKRIYIFTNGINRREDTLRKIVPVPFSVVRPFSQRLAKDMAGINEDISDITISVVGLGALGSQLVLNLARQGFSNWKLIDDDILLPHNFARHGLSALFRGQMKAQALKQELDLILERPKITHYCTRFDGIKDNKDRKMIDSEIIIDSTASYSVFLPLSYMEDLGQRTLSTYYTGSGLTSVLLSENKVRTIRLDDIDLQIKIRGLEDPIIKTIYRTRETNQLVYSTSCSSQTTVMAQDLVAIHAGIIT